jgi:CRISPR/Cas system Type II protein with McrA/HNH and RuvC-like nuclease domain
MNDRNGKRYNLGIDIGTSSLGLVAVDIDSKQIAYMDTIIYREPIESKGFKLFNVARREKRLVRRQIIRYKDRIRQIHHIFNDLGIGGVDIHKIGKDFDKNRDVIFLRAAAVKEKLSLPELARVILHLVKNRGYKGDLKSEVGDVKKGIKLTQEELLKYNVKTFGELLQKRREDSEKKRKEGSEQTGIAWRNLQEGGTFLARHTVEQEFCYIMFDSEQVDGFAKKFEAEHQNDKNKKEWGYFDCRDAKLKLKYLDFETTYKVENKKFFAGVLQARRFHRSGYRASRYATSNWLPG